MDEKAIPLTTIIRGWAEEQRRKRAEELPTPEELVAYDAGTLDGEAQKELQRSLALHPEAAQEFLDLTGFANLQPPDEHHQISDRDVTDALMAFRERVRRDEGAYENRRLQPSELTMAQPQATNLYPFPAERIRALRRRANLLAAAVLALAVLGASWAGFLHHQLNRYSGPQYAAVIDVETARGGRPHAISQQAEQVLLILHGVDLGRYRRGFLELATANGETVATFELNATADQGSLLYLPLSHKLLPDGSYRIRIYGDGEERALVKEYRFAVDVAESH